MKMSNHEKIAFTADIAKIAIWGDQATVYLYGMIEGVSSAWTNENADVTREKVEMLWAEVNRIRAETHERQLEATRDSLARYDTREEKLQALSRLAWSVEDAVAAGLIDDEDGQSAPLIAA